MKNVILLTVLFFGVLQISYAQSGELDPSFGNHGIVATDMGAAYNYGNNVRQVLLQTDGSIYVILQSAGQTLIEKKHADGSTDITYGKNGFSVSITFDGAHAALQADGKIVVTGTTKNAQDYDNIYDFAVARFNTNGSLDVSFNGTGIATTDFGYDDFPYCIAIQNDGKIVVAGRIDYSLADQWHVGLARYNIDGSLDKQAFANFSGPYSGDFANAVAIQSNGKIIIGGTNLSRYNSDLSLDSSFDADGVKSTGFNITSVATQSDGKIIVAGGSTIARYNIDGSPDNTFDGDGKQITGFSISLLTIQSNGKIIAAGGTTLARYNTNGSPDNTFDSDGKQTTNFLIFTINIQSDGRLIVLGITTNASDAYLNAASFNVNGSAGNFFDFNGKLIDQLTQGSTTFTKTLVQPDGKILAAGYAWNGSNYDFAIVRYNTDGSLDNTFSGDGKQMTDLGSTNDYAEDMAIQSDGKILVAGNSGDNNFVIVRYNTNGSLDNTFSGDGIQITDFGSSEYYYKASIAIQADGKILGAGALLARFNTDGSPDNSFNGTGKLSFADFDGEGFQSGDVAIQSDGKIIVAGSANKKSVVYRYNVDGSIDNTFGVEGASVVSVENFILNPTSVAIQNNGNIIIGGNRVEDDPNTVVSFFIERLTNNGSLDGTFKGGLIVTNINQNNYATSVVIQNDNKIILGGYSYNGSSDDFTLVRYNTDGNLDNTFDGDGIQITPVSSAYDRIESIAIAGNKLYAAGVGQYPGYLGVEARYFLDNNNNVTPPTVSLTNPTKDTSYIYPVSIKLTAKAADADGKVTKVEFYNGAILLGTDRYSGYSWLWKNVDFGNYTITAKAYDNSGNVTTSAPVHITVAPNRAPTVRVTSPANGATFTAPGTFYLTANANDPDGSIKTVDFYYGNTLIFTEYKAPFHRKWYNAPVGTYNITAVATDNYGLQTTSAPVTITVTSPDVAMANGRPSSINIKTGVNEMVSLNLAPNPSRDILNIYTSGLDKSKQTTVSVISASGIKMKTLQLAGSFQAAQLNVSSLAAGVYTIKVVNGSEILYRKFVKL